MASSLAPIAAGESQNLCRIATEAMATHWMFVYLCERTITKSEVIINVRVIGGLPMLDGGEADDKILGVMETDDVWSNVNDIEDLPPTIVSRLRHYFTTYKILPDDPDSYDVSIDGIYGTRARRKRSYERRCWTTATSSATIKLVSNLQLAIARSRDRESRPVTSWAIAETSEMNARRDSNAWKSSAIPLAIGDTCLLSVDILRRPN